MGILRDKFFIKVIVTSSLNNRKWLKQGRCSKASWVAPTWEWDLPLSRSPLLFIRLCGQLLATTAGLSCSELSSKGWVRPCVVGDREWSSVRWSRPRTVMGGTPSPANYGNPFLLSALTVLIVLPTFVAGTMEFNECNNFGYFLFTWKA